MLRKIGNIMNIWNYFNRSCRIIPLWILLFSHVHGQTTSRLSTSFLARGEQALFEISVIGGEPDGAPEIPKVKNLSIQPTGRGLLKRMLPGSRSIEYVFEYLISTYEVGKMVIPPIQVTVNRLKTLTESLPFAVFNPDELQWSEVKIGDKTIRYASSFRTMNDRPFENETTATEIKIYVPEEMIIEDWGIPDFERDGVTAWRFQPSPMRSRINLLGQPYVAVAYPSTFTPTRIGKIGIGPAKVRLMTREMVMEPFPRQVSAEVYLQVPKLEIQAKPLPEGAPEGFENAVGNFKLRANSASLEVQEGEPISVDLIISGSGNLDTLHPPNLENDAGWKVYGTTTEQRGDERRQVSGSVVFHQSIRSLEMKSAIPPFRLVYFDPKDKIYKTLTTDPIALQMRPTVSSHPSSDLAPQSQAVPFERMTDILAPLHPTHLTIPTATALPSWLGHALAGLIALALITKASWMRYASRFRQSPRQQAQLKELRDLEKSKSADDNAFLKSTGAFIERWLGSNSSPDLQAVLTERDAVCFRAEKPTTGLHPQRRDQILKLLRRAILACIALSTLSLATPSRAADLASQAIEAYQSAKYTDAVRLWLSAGNYQQLSADTLYNIGNACYRSNSPGTAALYYRRALLRDSSHQEARQNLRFLERRYGTIVVNRPEFQYTIAKFPLSNWQALTWSGLWLCGLAILVFPATRSGAQLRWLAIVALAIGPIAASVGILAWRYFPNDAEFATLERQAVIIEEKVVLHTDAARTAPEVIDAPPGSVCEIIFQSGRWAYVAFATKTRGWVPLESIEKIVPDKAPVTPQFHKTKADGKTA